MSETQIAAIMRKDPLCLSPGMPIREAAALLVDGNVPAAPVVDDTGGMVGILTQKDCFRSALNASYYQQWLGTVADHMTTTISTMNVDTDLVSAAQEFLDKPYRSYPVVKNSALVGMLDRQDLLGAFLRFG